ncbi:hypothetical protein EKH77_12615 [Streptomyces luteoverticillatus]|uniref:Uncharacterized protein n=1 Tax=Streptomyces luteoverticillatus TaxID=66425 RepID=A0A3S9PHT5_STRLT|nr:hypothetical protein [Streptomyces luteoverticillatus]AZQ71939.1 hypothetical protein EKH77_12615 [Streptomyces luteoverticillatus]
MTSKPDRTALIGQVVNDSDTGRIGKVMDKVGPRYQLRRLDGGREWEAKGDSLEVVIPLRCKYIARLKAERRKALEAGHPDAAHRFTVAMCRHLRVMHP